MFKVEEVAYGRFKAHRLIDASNGQYIEILSDFGAGINDLVIRTGKGTLASIISGYRSEEDIRFMHHSKFAGSKLSPFPNRIVEGKFEYDGHKYQLPVNEYDSKNHLHGFMHNKKYKVIEITESAKEAVLLLQYDYLGTIQGFPYSYELTIKYVLNTSGVEIKTSIRNTSDTIIPMGDGWHPYFKFEDLDSIELEMGKAQRISSLVDNPLVPVHGFESKVIIGDQAFDDCFELDESISTYEVRLSDRQNEIDFTLWQSAGDGQYNYCQIYTPPSRKEIAIEPVSCPPNGLNTKQSLIYLKPAQTVELIIGLNF